MDHVKAAWVSGIAFVSAHPQVALVVMFALVFAALLRGCAG
jgi:hypothetical protein